MSLQMPRQTGVSLFKEGYRVAQGTDEAVLRNIAAILELCNVTRTSLGPNGRNKIVINHLSKQYLTQDAATIVQELDVFHPAAKLVAMASTQQAKEFGDGTNFVLTFTGELLKKAQHLIELGVHTSDISKGYRQALDHVLGVLLPELIVNKNKPINLKDKDQLKPVIASIVASKQPDFSELLSELIVEAMLLVMPENMKQFNVDNIRVVKILGGSLASSSVIKGLMLPREPDSKVQNLRNCKVAVFLCPLDFSRTETKGTVLLHNAQEMIDFSVDEQKRLETAIKEIYNVGVRLVITGQAIGELARNYLDRLGMAALRVPSKFDLQRVCRIMGATPLARLGAPMPEEMGNLECFETTEVGGNRVTVLRQETQSTRQATILLRGNTKSFLDDVERAIDNGVSSLKTLIKDEETRLLPGAGATELSLQEKLVQFGNSQSRANQLAIKAFAEAFEIIPRTLAENAGLDATKTIANLHSMHHSQNSKAGVVLNEDDQFQSSSEANTYIDLYSTKCSAITLAAETAITVLQIDQVVMARTAGGPKVPSAPQGGHWDDD